MFLLRSNQYHLAHPQLKSVSINCLFARSVIEHHVSGKVYVDDVTAPNCCYVVHPYGMSLLYGRVEEDFLQSQLRDYMLGSGGLRKQAEFLQVYPFTLEHKIDAALGEKLCCYDQGADYAKSRYAVKKHQRINFAFNCEKFAAYLSGIDLDSYQFLSVDKKLFEQTKGSVVPLKFWNNYNDFACYGVGFSLLRDNTPVAVAFSSFRHENMLELGMETAADHRKQGFASIVSAKLILHCIDNGLEPIWACRAGNLGSYTLAMKMGFEPTAYLPYYELYSPNAYLD